MIWHDMTWYDMTWYDRRKFRSQTSDNMDRWKSRGGKSQRREEKKNEDQRRERDRRKKTQVREKVAKSRITVFFQWFVAPEGWKVGSLKRRVRSHMARCERKNCTPLWREAPSMSRGPTVASGPSLCDIPAPGVLRQTHHLGNSRTKRFWAVEKVHAVVARSTFWSQTSKKWRVRSEHFWTFRCCFAWQAQGMMHFVKSEQKVRVCSSFKYKYNHTTLHLQWGTST